MQFEIKHLTSLLGLLMLGLVGCAEASAGQWEEPTSEDGTSFRAVSYNIKHGLGNDGKLDLERTAEVLESMKPDFVG